MQKEIRWKPGKDVAHLETRKDWQHLPENATLDDYYAIIQSVLHDEKAFVYLYHYRSKVYPVVVAELDQVLWLVMCASDGMMETSFVVEEPAEYLSKREFQLIGSLKEVLA